MRFAAARLRRLVLPLFPIILAAGLVLSPGRGTETKFEFPGQHGCTSIMVGRLATVDGSVITSQTVDGEYRNWMEISPHRKNEAGAKNKIYTGRMGTRIPDDQRGLKLTGEIPEVSESYSFFNTAYPAANEHQLGMGETTVVGRRELRCLRLTLTVMSGHTKNASRPVRVPCALWSPGRWRRFLTAVGCKEVSQEFGVRSATTSTFWRSLAAQEISAPVARPSAPCSLPKSLSRKCSRPCLTGTGPFRFRACCAAWSSATASCSACCRKRLMPRS